MPKLTDEVAFKIDVDGHICRVYLYPDGTVGYNQSDFTAIKYKDVPTMRRMLDAVENRVLKSVRKDCFTI